MRQPDYSMHGKYAFHFYVCPGDHFMSTFLRSREAV
jgi:hypothetical protein